MMDKVVSGLLKTLERIFIATLGNQDLTRLNQCSASATAISRSGSPALAVSLSYCEPDLRLWTHPTSMIPVKERPHQQFRLLPLVDFENGFKSSKTFFKFLSAPAPSSPMTCLASFMASWARSEAPARWRTWPFRKLGVFGRIALHLRLAIASRVSASPIPQTWRAARPMNHGKHPLPREGSGL